MAANGADISINSHEAEDIFAAFSRERDTVEIAPGTEVEVRAIGIAGRVGLSGVMSKSLDNQFAWLVANGCPAFAGESASDIEARLDPMVLSKLAARIMELSGIGKDAEAQAEKNSESDPT